MVKPPKIRHSKSRRGPMTIELGPDDVSRIETAEAETPAGETGETSAAGPTAAEPDRADDNAPASGEAAETEAAAPAQDDVAAKTPDGEQPAARPAAEEDTAAFMGSEWPPEPETAGEATPPEEERVVHAFGRDPDSPPPASAARRERSDEEPPIRQPVRERRTSGLSAIAAGLVGGVIALAGAGALQFAGVLPSPGSGAAAPAVDDQAIAALRAELAELKGEVDSVKAGSGGDTSGLSQSVTELSSGVQGLSKALDQVQTDVAALKAAVSQGAAGDGAAVETLNQKLAALEASVAKLGEAGPGAPQEAIDAINQKLGAVEQAAAAATEAMKSGEGRLAVLEESVKRLSDQVSQQAAQPKVALAIAAAALKSAIERGGSFTAEVETFAAIAPEAPELPELREIAAKGVASRADITAGMDAAADGMIAASETPDEDAGFWESLLASAESLIKVRPIGEVEGDTVPAKVARMEVAVKAEDYGRALAEFDTLPDASKAAGQAFAELIRARLRAEELVAKALAGALKSA